MIEKLEKNKLDLQATSVYDFNELTLQDLLNKFFVKINECTDISNQALNFLEWLKDIGLPQEVLKVLEQMYNDGRLTELINKFLNDIQGRVENIETNIIDINTNIISLKDKVDKLNKLTNVNILDYSHLAINNDWSLAIETLINDNPKCSIKFPSGLYLFSKTIELNGDISLDIDINAELRAITPMEIFIKSHRDLDNLTRVKNTPQFIKGNGLINCNGLALIGLSLGGYRGFTYKDVKMTDFVKKGIVSKGENVSYAVELSIKDCYFEISNELTEINAIALDINSTDNHIDNVIIVDCFKGVQCSGYSNKFTKVHIWNRDRIKDKNIGYIGFDITGEDNLFDTCYGDTCNIAFKTVQGNSFVNCDVFNSQYFRALNAIGFEVVGTPNKPLTFINCKVKGDNETSIIEYAIKGTNNDFVTLLNCSTGFNVTNGFPKNNSIGATKFWGEKLDLSGNINAETQTIRDYLNIKNIFASGKVRADFFEFGSINKKLEVNNDYIPLCNGKVIPIYHNYKPLSTNDNGVMGQMYLDQTGLYIYFGSTIGWLMIDRATLKTF